RTKEPAHWYDLIASHNITLWNSVPQLMQLLVEHASMKNLTLDSLKAVMMSGDWIPLNLPDQIKAINQNVRVMSLGGATEGSIWSIWYEVLQTQDNWSAIPYGHAMPNQNMVVLNEFDEHCPIGVVGEIHIGGIGVALNYWQDEEKTNASYFDHPTLGRLYKTGDLGRWHQAGYINFEGRKDSQVKINGYRVELGEIECVLCDLPGIQQAVVIDVNLGGKKVLAAYFQSDELVGINGVTDSAALTKTLANKLPAYMVPSSFTQIDSVPLSANGKLDRKALPEPQNSINADYVAPTNEIQKQLCELWRAELGVEKIGITDSFFSIGGDSIAAIKLVGKMNQLLSTRWSVATLFTHNTIESLMIHDGNKIEQVAYLRALTPNSVGLPSLFMIHPSGSGCEVYQNLAQSLAGQFN
ncbi:MAG: non-ribosomal peptide synthetase, partial [Psychrosphaera sp.]|nr:non-ribosomal peptide synthetase [Psychrosphaera sp.]